MEKGIGSYLAPALLAIIAFLSIFIDTNLFNAGNLNIAVWFILSALCFAAGWYISTGSVWNEGVKKISAVTFAALFTGVVIVLMFSEYFTGGAATLEKLIVYSVRIILLGAMGIFGLAVSAVIGLDKEVYALREKVKLFDETIKDAKKESELIIRDAKIQAAKTINDAELAAKNTFLRKERIEKELKEFIQIEKELIKKYEENI